MIELRRVAGADDRDVVGDRGEVRQQLRQLGAGLAVLAERERRAEQTRRPFDEREPLPFRDEFRGDLLAVVLLQRRLAVEQVELRRRARHEEIDDVLRLRREVRRARRQRVVAFLREELLVQQRRQREAADAEAGLPKEVPPGHVPERPGIHAPHSLLSVSSRFSSAFATMVQAACSAGSIRRRRSDWGRLPSSPGRGSCRTGS